MCVSPIIPLYRGWMPEKQKSGPYVMLDSINLRSNWRIIVVVSFTGIAAPAMASITAFASRWIGLLCSSIVLAISVVGGYLWMPNRLIGHVALYQVLTMASKISFGGPLSYFFLADDSCLPGGPQFSYKFFITVTGIVGAAVSLVTVFIYQWLFSTWKFRNVLIFTSCLAGLGGIFDFLIVKRYNLAMGIPDAVFFLIGNDVLESITTMLYWIPSSSIIGKVCPKGMEAGTFAYLAGVSNFARMVSTILGAWLAEVFGVKSGTDTTNQVCNWDALPWLLLGGHVLLPLVVSLFAAFLIPNKGQRDDLLVPPPLPQDTETISDAEMGFDDQLPEDDFTL